MRICIVSTNLHSLPEYTTGGIESQVREQIRALAERGHDIHVMTVAPDNTTRTRNHENATYHQLTGESHRCTSMTAMLKNVYTFSRLARKQCSDLKPDIVHHHYRYPCLLMTATGLFRRDPWINVYHVHNWKAAEAMAYPAFGLRWAAAACGRVVDRFIATHTDHLVAISRFIHDAIQNHHKFDSSRISIIPNVVDLQLFKPDRNCRKEIDILFVGRIAAEKGVMELIKAIGILAQDRPEIKLHIIGPETGGTEHGSYINQCKNCVKHLNLGRNVRFCGTITHSELPGFYQRSRVVAVPSVWGEPCGVVVIEALATGVAVVATRTGGIPELIQHDQTGLLIDTPEIVPLANTLAKALDNTNLHVNALADGPSFVRRHCSGQLLGERLDYLYRNLIQNHRQPNPKQV